MPEKPSRAQLQEYKKSVPQISETEIIAPNWEAAHLQLGAHHRAGIQAELGEKKAALSPESYASRSQFLLSCKDYMLGRAAELNNSDPQLAGYIRQYFRCLDSWAQGANISGVDALMLQDEFFGCQTLLIRGNNGEVIFGQTEEYVEEYQPPRINEITNFTVDNRRVSAYTGYDYCLPGSAISYTPDGFMSVDTLWIKDNPMPGFLANTVGWIALVSGRTASLPDTIKNLLPTIDGYAINQVFVEDNGNVVAHTIEFAHGDSSVRVLGNSPGSYESQTNIVNPGSPVKPHEDFQGDQAGEDMLLSSLDTYQKILSRLGAWIAKGGQLPDSADTMRKALGFPGHPGMQEIACPYAWVSTAGVVFPEQGLQEIVLEPGPIINNFQS